MSILQIIKTLLLISVFTFGLIIVMLDKYLYKQEKHAEIPTKAKVEPQKILLLAYPRSGSSFLGDILSASNSSTFVFEPMFVFSNRTLRFTEAKANIFEVFLKKIFDCKYQILPIRRLRKGPLKCSTARLRLVKTIRAHSKTILPWILDTDIKVVHLVRDPRGIFSSLSNRSDTWEDVLGHFSDLCLAMEQDLQLAHKFPQNRYFRLSYEALLDEGEPLVKRIYGFMDLPYHKSERQVYHQLTHSHPKEDPRGRIEYYSTLRLPGKKHDTWKTELSPEDISQVERGCFSVMQMMGHKNFTKGS